MSENLSVELIAVEAQTSGPGIAELIEEVRKITVEVQLLRSELRATASIAGEPIALRSAQS